MKKKLFAGLLALMMVFATACGDKAGSSSSTEGGAPVTELSPYERLSVANTTYEEANSMSMDFVMDMTMAMDGEDLMSYVMSGDIQLNAEDVDSLEFAMKTATSVEVMGQSQVMEIDAYYRDGYYYMGMLGETYKMEMPIESAAEQAEVASAVVFDEQFILSQTEENGVLTFTVQGEAMTEYFNDMMGEMMQSFGEDVSLTYGDVLYVAHLNDDNQLEKMTMECTMDIEVMGEVATATMAMTMNVKAIGSSVVVSFPDDLDGYTEIDASLLGM